MVEGVGRVIKNGVPDGAGTETGAAVEGQHANQEKRLIQRKPEEQHVGEAEHGKDAGSLESHSRIQDPCCSSARDATETAAGLTLLGTWNLKDTCKSSGILLNYSLSVQPWASHFLSSEPPIWKGVWRVRTVLIKI